MLLTREFDRREHIAFGDSDERVRFIVLEVGVEPGGVLIDEVLLEHQGLVFIAHHDVLERADLLDEQRDLRAFILEVDILAHASTKLFGLADVDDAPVRVGESVDARRGRNVSRAGPVRRRICHGPRVRGRGWQRPSPSAGVLYVMKPLNNETNTRARHLWAYTGLGCELTHS